MLLLLLQWWLMPLKRGTKGISRRFSLKKLWMRHGLQKRRSARWLNRMQLLLRLCLMAANTAIEGLRTRTKLTLVERRVGRLRLWLLGRCPGTLACH